MCTAPWPAVRSAQRRPRARDGLSADAQQLRVREQIPGGRGGAVGGRPRVCQRPLLPARGRPSCPRTLSLSAPRFLWLWHSRRGPHAAGTVLALLNAASSVSRTAGRPPPRGTVSRTRSLCSRAATLTAPHTCVRGPRSGPGQGASPAFSSAALCPRGVFTSTAGDFPRGESPPGAEVCSWGGTETTSLFLCLNLQI